jgi:hypothetical protein
MLLQNRDCEGAAVYNFCLQADVENLGEAGRRTLMQRRVISSGARIPFGAVAGAKDRLPERETCRAKRWFAPVEMGWQKPIRQPRFDRRPGSGGR